MLIRGVILFLSVIEGVWDIFDKVRQLSPKGRKKQGVQNKAFQKVKPLYSN